MRSIESEWESYYGAVLQKQGLDNASVKALRQVFFTGAGSVLSMAGTVPLVKLSEEIMAFHASLLGRSN